MRLVPISQDNYSQISDCVKKYGFTPDHNFDWFLYCSDGGGPRVFMWDEGYAVFAYVDEKNNSFVLLSDPIAPEEQHRRVLKEAIDLILPNYKKITVLDVRDNVHNIIKKLYPDNYEFYYDMVWPVVDMDSFGPELPGGHFKDIRNALNKFSREHKVEIKEVGAVDPERNREGSQRASVSYGIDKKDLHGIVDRWMDDRTKAGIEELYATRYHNMIDGNFRGTDSARVMFVDGKAVGFNAGWEMPNSPTQWSASIGLHDFSVKDLGIALFVEDLNWIKNAGYKICDLEGSDPQALRFKTQFFPEYKTYKTCTFWLKK